MNTAVRAAVRLGLDKGHQMFGIQNGFAGFVEGQIFEMNWMSVNGWAPMGGSELGTNRRTPDGKDLYLIARNIEQLKLDGLLIIGGITGYETAYNLWAARDNYPAFNLPIVCMPASINNNLPGSDLSIGADTALNNIVGAVDKIKDSAVAARRVFVVEVMGRKCGYLALMSGLATGAERVYTHETGITLKDLQEDVEGLVNGFTHGKRLGLVIRNEHANQVYSTGFMVSLFEEEGGNTFDVRQSILGHLQQGGPPSPFDRIQATRLATRCIDYLINQAESVQPTSTFMGLQGKEIVFNNLEDFPRMVDLKNQRPKQQWWLDLRPVAKTMSQPSSQKPAAG